MHLAALAAAHRARKLTTFKILMCRPAHTRVMKRGFSRALLLVIAFALAPAPGASTAAQMAPDAALMPPAVNVTVPVQNENGVLLLSVTLDGTGPLLFTFDPGAGDLYTQYARSRLNGRAPQTVCLLSACFTASLEYFDGNPAELFPRHDVSLGSIAGSIGPALLQRYVVQIDYRASTLTLIPPARFQPPAGVKALALQYDSSGMPAIAAAIDGTPVLVELDVRAPTSMLFTPFLERSGLRHAYAGTPVVKQSGILIAHAVGRVQVSGAELHDMAFWFSTASSGKFAAADVAGLLGNNVLSHFVVTMDTSRRRVYLVPSP